MKPVNPLADHPPQTGFRGLIHGGIWKAKAFKSKNKAKPQQWFLLPPDRFSWRDVWKAVHQQLVGSIKDPWAKRRGLARQAIRDIPSPSINRLDHHRALLELMPEVKEGAKAKVRKACEANVERVLERQRNLAESMDQLFAENPDRFETLKPYAAKREKKRSALIKRLRKPDDIWEAKQLDRFPA